MKLKRIITLLFTISALTVLSVCTYNAESAIKYNITDATYIQKCIVELEQVKNGDLEKYDFNGNGVLDITDATYIKYMIVQLPPPEYETTSTTTATENPTIEPTTALSPTTVPVGPQYLYIDEGEIILVAGEEYQINVICDKDKQQLHFSSLNTNIATVDSSGNVKALKAGNVTIEVKTSNGLKDSCLITVISPPKSVALNESRKQCKVGDTFTLTAKTDTSNYPYEYIWKSSNPSIAAVYRDSENSAVIKIMSQGNAEITVETFNGKTASCSVNSNGSNVKCIDVSVWQGDIDFNKVKADGIEYVILRAGFGRENYQKDNKFEEYYANAKAAGLKIGVYWFSYAVTPEEGKDEAKACLYCLGNKELDMPVYYDMEYEPALLGLSKEENTQMAVYFCEAVKAAGYDVGIYSSTSAYTYNLNLDKLRNQGYSIWNAQWYDFSELECDIWQYGSEYGISGTTTDVDCNYIYNLNIVKQLNAKTTLL